MITTIQIKIIPEKVLSFGIKMTAAAVISITIFGVSFF